MRFRGILATFATIGLCFSSLSGCGQRPSNGEGEDPAAIAVKVVVMAMFERGEPTGDSPGELQLWVERLDITQQLEFPAGESDIYLTDEGVMVLMLGGGIPNATATVMALGYDPRFDLKDAYFLIAGIAGADPADLSLGSAAWARHVVDGDLAYEIDGREIPAEWPYGMIPLGLSEPKQDPVDLTDSWSLSTSHFPLNTALVDWAYALTKDINLGDAPGITEFRELYDTYPAAQRAPFVTVGDTLSSSTYWHGELLNTWANDWLKLYAGAEANFMTSNMEDSGTLTALHRLARNGLVDAERVLVLRTASNFTMPPAGKTALWSKSAPYPDNGLPSLESAYLVGRTVVDVIVANWDDYQGRLPQAADLE
ncbi:MAG: purine nucleoside permease [Pseudomonadota bacterium]